MRFFFRSKKFKIISAVALLLVVSIAVFGFFTNWSAPQSNILSSVLTPVQNFASGVSSSVGGFFENMQNSENLQKKIDELESQLAEKNYALADYENVVRQNEFYKEFLEIKEDNPSFDFSAAMVIARDTSDPYGSFTINKGTLDGVSVYDPVITADGLVGYISDAYSTQSTVMTILNPSINISAIDNRTRDSGNITGDMAMAANKMCSMIYISKSNTMAAGDYIMTSGAGNVFPAGQLIGTVSEIKSSGSKNSCYASIKPAVDVFTISDVMVVTDFEGQNMLNK